MIHSMQLIAMSHFKKTITVIHAWRLPLVLPRIQDESYIRKWKKSFKNQKQEIHSCFFWKIKYSMRSNGHLTKFLCLTKTFISGQIILWYEIFQLCKIYSLLIFKVQIPTASKSHSISEVTRGLIYYRNPLEVEGSLLNTFFLDKRRCQSTELFGKKRGSAACPSVYIKLSRCG